MFTQTTSMHVLMQAAACRRFLGDLRGASEVYERSECPVLCLIEVNFLCDASHRHRLDK